jgi:hypothetical protein
VTQSCPPEENLAENRKSGRIIRRLCNIIRTRCQFLVLRTEIECLGYVDTIVCVMAPGNPRTSSIMLWETCMPKTLIAIFRGELGFYGIREMSHLEEKTLAFQNCMKLGDYAPYDVFYIYTKFVTRLNSQILATVTPSCPKLPKNGAKYITNIGS